MLRKIYLLRHAQAESGFHVSDKERNLTDFGKQQALSVGVFLKTQDIETVLCSEATRTQQTLDQIIKAGVNFKNVKTLEKLYNAPTEILWQEIEQNEGNILVIAHNPGTHQLAFNLSKEGDSSLIDQLAMGYPPATLSIFENKKLIDLIFFDQ